MRLLLRLGWTRPDNFLLTVRGRKSGKRYTTPITLVVDGERRWLVAPYGEVSWLRNARAAGQVTLARGRHAETVSLIEIDPAERAPILKRYLAREPVTRPYFDAGPDAPIAAFEVEAARHPVFLLRRLEAIGSED